MLLTKHNILKNKPLQKLFGSLKKPNGGSGNFVRGSENFGGGSENFGRGSGNIGRGSGNIGGGSGNFVGGSGKIVQGSGKFAGGVFYAVEIFGQLSGLHRDKVPEPRRNNASPTSLDFLKYFNFRKAHGPSRRKIRLNQVSDAFLGLFKASSYRTLKDEGMV